MGPFSVSQIWRLRAEDRENGSYRIDTTQTFEMAEERRTVVTGVWYPGTTGG